MASILSEDTNAAIAKNFIKQNVTFWKFKEIVYLRGVIEKTSTKPTWSIIEYTKISF